MTALAIRPDLETTLGTLSAEMVGGSGDVSRHDLSLDKIEVHADSDTPVIKIDTVEVPMTPKGMASLADYLKVPTSFFDRLGSAGGVEEQAHLVKVFLDNSRGETVRVGYTEGGLVSLTEPRDIITASHLIPIAARVLGDDAPVVRVVDTNQTFGLDATVSLTAERGVGGDRTATTTLPEEVLRQSWVSGAGITADSQVGDLTTAGVRIGLDVKRGLAPTVQPYFMRLACTNGMETVDLGQKIDARGLSFDEVLEEFGAMCERAFSQAEAGINHFYDLREQRVDNPERVLRQVARERGLPNRSLNHLLDLAPTDALPDDPSMFDVVNLVTNLANNTSLVRNDGGRQLLEQVGGGVVGDSAARCNHCNQQVH